jgi:hypothetical protein
VTPEKRAELIKINADFARDFARELATMPAARWFPTGPRAAPVRHYGPERSEIRPPARPSPRGL